MASSSQEAVRNAPSQLLPQTHWNRNPRAGPRNPCLTSPPGGSDTCQNPRTTPFKWEPQTWITEPHTRALVHLVRVPALSLANVYAALPAAWIRTHPRTPLSLLGGLMGWAQPSCPITLINHHFIHPTKTMGIRAVVLWDLQAQLRSCMFSQPLRQLMLWYAVSSSLPCPGLTLG